MPNHNDSAPIRARAHDINEALLRLADAMDRPDGADFVALHHQIATAMLNAAGAVGAAMGPAPNA